MLQKLEIGIRYQLKVKSVIAAAEAFISQGSGEKMFSHQFILVEENSPENEYRCQIVDKNDTQEYAKAKDTIVIEAKRYTQGIHTITIINNESKNGYDQKRSSPPPANNNPIMGGTAAAVALNASVGYWTQHEDSYQIEKVLETADHFFNWLKEKHLN